MKLSKREKILISILLFVIMVYFGYWFISFDRFFKTSQLEEAFNQKKFTYDNMSKNILMKKYLDKNLKELTEEINNTNLLSDLQQEKILVFLNNYLANNKINANNISFTDSTVITMNVAVSTAESKGKSSLEAIMDEINKTQNNTSNSKAEKENITESSFDTNQTTQAVNETQASALTARSMSVNVVFESTYNDLINFIDAIQNNPIEISVTNINTVSAEGGLLQGTMTLNFYEVPKLDGYVEKNKDWIWSDLFKYGKSNPFILQGAAAFSNVIGSKFDFYISLKPESSDLPTVIVGKSEDEKRLTYVYADSNTMENVEIQFKKDDNKYYYKYSTKNSSFPSDGTWLDFTPVGSSISVKIYSSQRNSKADSAGANINVVNTSGLKILFEIEGDDISNPRVYFKDPKSVRVTRR